MGCTLKDIKRAKFIRSLFLLTFFISNDIIISRYNDIILGVLFLKISSRAENKMYRTKQVQFRMNPKIFYQLKSTIVFDENMHSMADLFNEAAKKYLEEKGVKIDG